MKVTLKSVIKITIKATLWTLVLLAITYGFISYLYSVDIDDIDSWEQMPIYNIRFKEGPWRALDIRIPPQLKTGYNRIEYQVAIPHRYQLTQKDYVIDIEVNPTRHSMQANLQILVTSSSESQELRIEPSWAGNCGEIGSSRTFLLTNPKGISFVWRRHSGDCSEEVLENIENVSFDPILLKVYDGSKLLGEERIDFEIFNNGIMRYVVPLWDNSPQ